LTTHEQIIELINLDKMRAYQDGWNQCLDSVRDSLKDYPNADGDIEIMREVERIEKAAIARWYAEGQR